MNVTKSTFETLKVWIKGRELRKKISELIKKIPPEEKYRLTELRINVFFGGAYIYYYKI